MVCSATIDVSGLQYACGSCNVRAHISDSCVGQGYQAVRALRNEDKTGRMVREGWTKGGNQGQLPRICSNKPCRSVAGTTFYPISTFPTFHHSFCYQDISGPTTILAMDAYFVSHSSTQVDAWVPPANEAEITLDTIDDSSASNPFSEINAQESQFSDHGLITGSESLANQRVEKSGPPHGAVSLMGHPDTPQSWYPSWTSFHSAAILEPALPPAGNSDQK